MFHPFKINLPILCSLFLLLCFCEINTVKAQTVVSSWEDLKLYGGQVTSIAVHPEKNSTVYAATWDGEGLFKSDDGGKSWFAVPSNDSPWFKNTAVFDISIDPNNPENIWVANDDYIDISRDHGLTWETLDFASQEGRFCFTVAVDPHDDTGNTVYAGTGGPFYTDRLGTVFKTTDSGKTWQKTNLRADFNVYDLQINPQNPDEVWAACNTYHVSPNGQICMTSDGGLSWAKWNFDWYIDEILIHPENPQLIFAGGEKGVIRKDDGTNQDTGWQNLEPSKFCSSLCIPPASPVILYAGLTDEVAKTTDLGGSWSYYESPGEFLSLSADLFDSHTIYGGHSNRGLYKSTDGAQTWVEINNGIRANAIFSSDISPFDNSTILSGTFSGVYKSSDNNTWRLINTELSEAVAFHPTDKNIIYAGFDWQIGKSTDGGSTWSYVSIFDQGDAYGVSSISVSPLLPDTVFAGVFFFSGKKGCVIKSSDSGEHYNVVHETSVPVNCVMVHPASPEIIYAGTGNFYFPVTAGRLYKSTDEGITWKSTSLKNVVVNSIAVSGSDPELVYAGCGAQDYSSSGIYKSTDGGRTWEQKICGLPVNTGILKFKKQPYFAVTDLRVDSKNDDIVYAALYDQGIYASIDAGNYWTRIGLSDYLIYTVNTGYSTLNGSSSKKLPARLSTFSSNVIAGTASGIYQYKTSGTGILTGTISSAETGELIDSVMLSTSYDSGCLSSSGYYLLLLPAGTHSITAQATGYMPATVPDITVHAGRSSTCNISLLPQTDNGTCLASLLLNGTSLKKEIPLLRSFRDRVLNKTTLGKHLVTLYYTLGEDVWQVLQKHSSLRKRCIKLIRKSTPVIEASLSENNPPATSALLSELSPLLFDLEIASPPGLKKEINRLRKQMRSFNLEELFTHINN